MALGGVPFYLTFMQRGKSVRQIINELCFTKDSGAWPERKWESVPATVDAAAGRASAPLPQGVKLYYLNLVDERGLVVSSEHGVSE